MNIYIYINLDVREIDSTRYKIIIYKYSEIFPILLAIKHREHKYTQLDSSWIHFK